MPTQTLIKKLGKQAAEAIIAKTAGADEQIEVSDYPGGGCLVRCKANSIGGNTHESAPFAPVIQSVADAETKLVTTEAKANRAKEEAEAKAKKDAAAKVAADARAKYEKPQAKPAPEPAAEES